MSIRNNHSAARGCFLTYDRARFGSSFAYWPNVLLLQCLTTWTINIDRKDVFGNHYLLWNPFKHVTSWLFISRIKEIIHFFSFSRRAAMPLRRSALLSISARAAWLFLKLERSDLNDRSFWTMPSSTSLATVVGAASIGSPAP